MSSIRLAAALQVQSLRQTCRGPQSSRSILHKLIVNRFGTHASVSWDNDARITDSSSRSIFHGPLGTFPFHGFVQQLPAQSHRHARVSPFNHFPSRTAFQVTASGSGETAADARLPSRLAQKSEFLRERTEAAEAEAEGLEGPVPRITVVSTKVDMRFNVWEAEWLPERIRLKIIDQEANRINSDGELVVSSTRTRTQKGNIEDALSKLQKIIDAAAYVPPPPSKEKVARIKKLAKAENERRLQSKKQTSNKKAERRNKGSWD